MAQDAETQRLRGFGDTNVVLFGQGDGTEGAAPLTEASFSLEVQGEAELRWRVRRFEVREALSALYECAIDLASEAFTDNPEAMLGRYAMLGVQREEATRRFFGVVRRVEQLGTTGTGRLARIYVVPALWTLSQRSDSRIFQDMTAVEVVLAVLRAAELYADAIVLRLLREYPSRTYCVQYRETDLAFVQRLLEHDGITYFFLQGEASETLVLADGPHAWEAVRTIDDGPIPIAGAEGSTHRRETVRNLTWEREERPTSVTVRDFDFTRPGFRVEGMSPRRVPSEKRGLYDPAPTVAFERYAGAAYTRDDAHEQSQLRLEAELTSAAMGQGEGRVMGMSPGATFGLTLAGAHLPSQRYVVLGVEHIGDAQEQLVLSSEREALLEDRYHNRFRCALLGAPYRPARTTPRPVIAGLQTATVTGPRDEEIYTDEHGRIRVRFHWDRAGGGDERSSCWLRAMQGPWAGAGWGFQFLPRVGMEVAVSFLEGDPDRPVIVGALYNGEHGAPFALPGERSRSGIRTQTVGGVGNNELSFEDGAGREQVFLRAQRDFDEEVVRDHSLDVGADETLCVAGNQRQTVGGRQEETIVGEQTLTVESSRRELVRSKRSVVVLADQEHRIEGNDGTTVHGDVERSFAKNATTRVGGRLRQEVKGMATHTMLDDLVTQIRGHQVTMVGRHEAKRSSLLHVEGAARSWSSGVTEIEAEEAIVLRCGRSIVKLTPDRLELIAPEVIVRGGDNLITASGGKVRVRAEQEAIFGAPEVTVKSAGAAVKLDAEAKVMGAKVNLGAGSIPLDDATDEHARITTIALHDERGAPIPNQRFVLRMDDGSEQTGVVNADGKATVEISGVATIEFPELRDAEVE